MNRKKYFTPSYTSNGLDLVPIFVGAFYRMKENSACEPEIAQSFKSYFELVNCLIGALFIKRGVGGRNSPFLKKESHYTLRKVNKKSNNANLFNNNLDKNGFDHDEYCEIHYEQDLVIDFINTFPLGYKITPEDNNCYDFFLLADIGMKDLMHIDDYLDDQARAFNEFTNKNFARYLQLLLRKYESFLHFHFIDDKLIQTINEWIDIHKKNEDFTSIKVKTSELIWSINKIDLIKFLLASYDLNCFNSMNKETKVTQELIMKVFGRFLNIDLSSYQNNLNQAFGESSIETNLKFFEDLKKAIQKRFYVKEEKVKKKP